MRQAFRFMLSHRTPNGDGVGKKCVQYEELLEFADRMRKLFSGMGLESSKTRMMTTITILQLEAGDFVKV